MNYIVVAYFTLNTGYADEVQHLITDLKHLQLPMDIVGVPSLGSWKANTHYKAYFLKQMLMRHYPKDLLYLDADARVYQQPSLFDQVDFDLALFYLDSINFGHKELISSTMYFANNAKVSELLERWISLSFKHPDVWDQQILQYAIQESEDLKLNIHFLPPTYCQIFDLDRIEPPVIEQFQASRRYKYKISEQGRNP